MSVRNFNNGCSLFRARFVWQNVRSGIPAVRERCMLHSRAWKYSLYFRHHKRSRQTSDHGTAVRYMGGAGTGENFGSSPLSQVRYSELSHSQCLILYVYLDASKHFLQTRKILPKLLGLSAHYRGVVTYGVENASSLSAQVGLSIRVMVCQNLST
jgi:hypothetical protein